MSNNFNKDFFLSICVPTFNRDILLKKLLDSVDSNYNDKVEVVIVDDGSNDLTRELCNKYKDMLNVKYIYQVNSGRSHALRKSILNASGEYVVIMDSDDIFVNNGVNIIVESLLDLFSVKSQEDIAGAVFLCVSDKNLIGKNFNNYKSRGNLLRDVADLGITGDKKEVIKLKILKTYMYEPYKNEKRMATSILWNKISSKYDVININKVVANKDYHNDGLSKNIDKVRMLSCRSSALYYSEALNYHKIVYFSNIYAFKLAANLVRYSLHCKSIEFIRSSRNGVTLISLSCVVGLFFYIKDKVKFSSTFK